MATGDESHRIRKHMSKQDRSIGPSGAPRRRFRTIWISDVHLGTRGCNCELLLDFLDHTDCDTLYLVGDIIDGWRLKKRFYWPERHNAISIEMWRQIPDAARALNDDDAVREVEIRGVGCGQAEPVPS